MTGGAPSLITVLILVVVSLFIFHESVALEEELSGNKQRRLQVDQYEFDDNEIYGYEESGSWEGNQGFLQDFVTDVHFRPGAREPLPINQMEQTISGTFLNSPPWAQDEIFNESSYSSFYRLHDKYASLSNREISEIQERVRADYEQQLSELRNQSGSSFASEEEWLPDYTAKEQLAMERAMRRKFAPAGVRVMCYCENIEDIRDRCFRASEWGNNVYIQINRMASYDLPLDDPWYEEMRKLKRESELNIFGVFFGRERWELLKEILGKTHDFLSGVVVGVNAYPPRNGSEERGITLMSQVEAESDQSEVGENGCVTDLESFKASKIPDLYPKLSFSYLSKDENPTSCLTSQGLESRWDLHVNHPDRDLKIPEEIEIIFPCYDGYEGRCFHAFNRYPETACDLAKQRYMFAPYTPSGNNILHMFNEVCIGLGLQMPDHDVVQAIP